MSEAEIQVWVELLACEEEDQGAEWCQMWSGVRHLALDYQGAR